MLYFNFTFIITYLYFVNFKLKTLQQDTILVYSEKHGEAAEIEIPQQFKGRFESETYLRWSSFLDGSYVFIAYPSNNIFFRF